jgi:ABC-type bacteriocin/lantibiotic exporter with double-glycine peptidase domain
MSHRYNHYAKKRFQTKLPTLNRANYTKTRYAGKNMLKFSNTSYRKQKTTGQTKLIIALSPFIFIGSMIFFMFVPVLFAIILFIGFIYLLITWW